MSTETTTPPDVPDVATATIDLQQAEALAAAAEQAQADLEALVAGPDADDITAEQLGVAANATMLARLRAKAATARLNKARATEQAARIAALDAACATWGGHRREAARDAFTTAVAKAAAAYAAAYRAVADGANALVEQARAAGLPEVTFAEAHDAGLTRFISGGSVFRDGVVVASTRGSLHTERDALVRIARDQIAEALR